MSSPAAPDQGRARWRRVADALASWRKLSLTVAVFLLLPQWPQLRAALPVEQTAALLALVIAVCALVGWLKGGSATLAVIWLALATLLFVQADIPVVGTYGLLARGWIILIAGSFGLVSVIVSGDAFFPRALAALGVAFALAFGIVLVSPGGMDRASTAFQTELDRRAAESNASMRATMQEPEWKQLFPKTSGMPDLARMQEEQLTAISKWSAILVPAIAALESLAALALGWAIYHKLNGAPIGAPLGKFRDFRFNDQLVWGVAVGASIFLLQAFADGKNAGLNLLVFFGSLYLLRGIAIIAWLIKGRLNRIMLCIAGVFAWWLMAPVALMVGLGDTWLDWRSRMPAKPVT